MPRRSYSTEQVVRKLLQAEGGAGPRLADAAGLQEVGGSEQTYYRRRKGYGALRLDQAKRLKDLERENVRLKRLAADHALDNSIVTEVVLDTSRPTPTPTPTPETVRPVPTGETQLRLGSLIKTGSLTGGRSISRMSVSENTMQSFTGTTRT